MPCLDTYLGKKLFTLCIHQPQALSGLGPPFFRGGKSVIVEVICDYICICKFIKIFGLRGAKSTHLSDEFLPYLLFDWRVLSVVLHWYKRKYILELILKLKIWNLIKSFHIHAINIQIKALRCFYSYLVVYRAQNCIHKNKSEKLSWQKLTVRNKAEEG